MWNEAAITCLDHFSVRSLNGRHRNTIFVGDQPDARHCSSLVCGTVFAHHRTQQPSRFSEGYIGIRTAGGSKYFDRHKRTIDGRPTYLFVGSKDIHTLSRIIDGITKTVEQYRSAPFRDLVALNQLLDERLTTGTRAYRFMSESIWRTSLVEDLRRKLRQPWLDGGLSLLGDVVGAACPIDLRPLLPSNEVQAQAA